MAKKTPLYEMHLQSNAKMVEFAGFDMPIQYAGITQEHDSVRESVGIFDVSHMGKFMVEGSKSEEFLNHCITNDLTRLSDGQVQYSPMCYENGGTVDDIVVYRYNQSKYMLVVNAANMDKDWDWLQNHMPDDVKMTNLTDGMVQLALQGPGSLGFLLRFTEYDLSAMKFYWFADKVKCFDVEMLLSRTGYTGEDGFELYFDREHAEAVWNAMIEAGAEPCGLGCRDTLRFEAGMPLYGDELSENISPLEAGLDYFVKLDKGEFVGRDALKEQYQNRPRKLVGLEILDKGIVRHGENVLDAEDNIIGFVTTGYKSPSLGKSLAMALIKGTYELKEVSVTMRKKILKAKIVPRRFYKKKEAK